MSNEITRDLVRTLLPPRPATAHKGTFGHLLVLAGSRGFAGAAKLAGRAALRSGAGLVTVAVPEPLADVMAASLAEAMTLALPATPTGSFSMAACDPALGFVEDKQAAVLGPGLGRDEDTQAFARGFIQQCTAPLLVDADGLNALSDDPARLRHCAGPRVLTPHPGEMAGLCAGSTATVQAQRESTAADFAMAYGCVVVLKGYRTVVANETGDVYVNPTGNAGLATGGTGDVLAGLVGGLMAQGLSGLDAAVLGVFTHGLAGDIAAAAKTQRGLIAGDVIEALPTAWHAIESAE